MSTLFELSDNSNVSTPPKIGFPPTEEDLSKISLRCARGECPFSIGKSVPLESYNAWLESSETGLRTDYDSVNQLVIVGEGCLSSHGATRLALSFLFAELYDAFDYSATMGAITTGQGNPNVSPDARIQRNVGDVIRVPIAAEVGGSRSMWELSARSATLFNLIPTLEHVVLIKVFDTETHECGRMVAWTESRDYHDGVIAPIRSPLVEFGRRVAGGYDNPAWWQGVGMPPVLELPAFPVLLVPDGNIFPAAPAQLLNLGAILNRLRSAGGTNWRNRPDTP
jgi:hypothetical protein